MKRAANPQPQMQHRSSHYPRFNAYGGPSIHVSTPEYRPKHVSANQATSGSVLKDSTL
jgi:hypothetical protein